MDARVPFGRVVRIDGLLGSLIDFEEAYEMLLTDQRAIVRPRYAVCDPSYV